MSARPKVFSATLAVASAAALSENGATCFAGRATSNWS